MSHILLMWGGGYLLLPHKLLTRYNTMPPTVVRSIVSDFSWVCGESWVPALSQAIFFLGKITVRGVLGTCPLTGHPLPG